MAQMFFVMLNCKLGENSVYQAHNQVDIDVC